jgi:hypothetical protein
MEHVLGDKTIVRFIAAVLLVIGIGSILIQPNTARTVRTATELAQAADIRTAPAQDQARYFRATCGFMLCLASVAAFCCTRRVDLDKD